MSVPPQVTLRLSLKRNGEILGGPLISYENPHISEADRAALHAAVAAGLARCTPLPISDAFGGIIAGHPIHVKLGEGWRGKKDRRLLYPKDSGFQYRGENALLPYTIGLDDKGA